VADAEGKIMDKAKRSVAEADDIYPGAIICASFNAG